MSQYAHTVNTKHHCLAVVKAECKMECKMALMGIFSFRVLLALSTIFNQALTTRFLPSVIWDKVNPL